MVDRDPRISVEDVERLATVGVMLGGSALLTLGWHVKEVALNAVAASLEFVDESRNFVNWNLQDAAFREQPFHPAHAVRNAGRTLVDMARNIGLN